jgi:hypothetical protein
MSNSPFTDQKIYPLVVGVSNSPFTDQRAVSGGVNPPVDLNSLDISYDTENSVLILSDPLLINPFISATTIVTGRTVLIEDVFTNASAFVAESVIGLSNTVFPPPPSTKLIGNNPVAVYFPNQFTGLTSWFSGGSFRATISGKINKLSLAQTLICTIWSNRGQPTQLKLNEFSLVLESVSGSSGFGWSWDVIFTCRSINGQITHTKELEPEPKEEATELEPEPKEEATELEPEPKEEVTELGSVATNSSFSYSDDRVLPGVAKPEGVIVSNVVSNGFNTNINQYLDFTFSFSNPLDGLTTNLFIIERIY